MTLKPSDIQNIGAFLTTLLAIEQAWALLDEAERADNARPVHNIEEAVLLGGASASILTRAAALLAPTDPARAHHLLEQAVALDAPPAPAQLALARSFRKRGDDGQASHWLRGAMLRSRPDAALLLELAAIETDHARQIVDAATVFPRRDRTAAADAGCALLALGKRKEARIAFDIAFSAGARDPNFLILYSDLLADTALHDDPPLPTGPFGMPHWWNIATSAAQARLAAAHPPSQILPVQQAREESGNWVGTDQLAPLLADRIARREPFSWIRLGDSEARFLLYCDPDLRRMVPEREADAMMRLVWHVWFGQDFSTVTPSDLAALRARFDRAVRNADLLGAMSVDRLKTDPVHYGFYAGLEFYLRALLAERPDTRINDALIHLTLNQTDPFLASLLTGIDFLGVIGPHPELAGRLQRHLGIGMVRHYDIPGEGRLDRPRERANRGTHFPAVYARLMAEIEVPRPGALFLVGGGLLGKIYCDRIRELGGIAIDIGALADAWMGLNTRGAVLDTTMRWQLPA